MSCPGCARSTLVPGIPVAPKSGGRTWPWVFLVTLLALAVAAAAHMMRPPAEAAGGDIVAGTLSPFIIAAVPALLLALLVGSGALLIRRSFGRSAGLTYSVLLLPLTLLVLLIPGQSRVKMLQMTQVLQDKTQGIQQRVNGYFNKTIRPLLPKPEPTRAEVEAATAGMKEDARKLLSSMVDENGLPQHVDVQFPVGPPPTNEAEKLRVFMQSFFADMVTLQNSYLKELEEAGISTLLAPDRVVSDADFKQTPTMLVQIRAIVQDYKAKADALMVNFPQKIESSDFDQKTKAGMVRGYQQGLAKSMPLFRETWDIEVSSVELMSDILDHLHAKRKSWTLQNGQYMFQEQADVDRFNQLMDELDRGIQRQSEIRQKSMEGVEANMKKF